MTRAVSDDSRDAARPALALEGMSKVFRGQRALDNVDLELRAGEVHALLGQNGSGKSTLIKVLAGYHQPEPGWKAEFYGAPLALGNPEAAARAGIRFIHQDLGLVDDLSVVDNLALPHGYAGRWWLSSRRERRAAQRLLHEYEVDLDPSQPVRTLSPARQAMVAIVRALRDGVGESGLLVLDEPTAALQAEDVAHLFNLIAKIRERRGTVLYVTHRLHEVFEIADRVTVLRDGRRITTTDVASLDHDRLVELILGRPLEDLYPPLPDPGTAPALEVEGLRGHGVRDVSLAVREGEIVGVTGLVGSGYESVLHLLFGARKREAGAVRMAGGTLVDPSPYAAIKAGLAFAPADRKRLSAMLSWTIRENVTLPKLDAGRRRTWLSARRERGDVTRWLGRLEVTPNEPERVFGTLSGGNQQKAVLARWLRCGAKVFLLEEPTNGVDMGAKSAIYRSLAEVAAGGAGVLVSSSDGEELCAICDRVLVMRDGRIATVLDRAAVTVERLLAESVRESAPPQHNGGPR